jgi:predicted hydrocarbon binding protein
MTSSPEYFYPERMGRIVLQAMEEILGREGVGHLLEQTGLQNGSPDFGQPNAFSFEQISRLQAGLETVYGPCVGRGLALRTGRASMKFGLRSFGAELGLMDAAFRLAPLPLKLKIGSQALADLFNQTTDQRVRLDQDAQRIYWQIERCPLCWQRHADGACCHMAVGVLQEALYWISGGKSFEVSEEKCIACGDSACTIVINRTPLS